MTKKHQHSLTCNQPALADADIISCTLTYYQRGQKHICICTTQQALLHADRTAEGADRTALPQPHARALLVRICQ